MSCPRIVASLWILCLLCLPALASQPEGVAANLITDLGDPEPLGGLPAPGGICDHRSFDWYEYFGAHELLPSDTLRLEFALLPFASGITSIAMDDGLARTFFSIDFADGLVHGLPYRRHDWNDVVVDLRPATQDYVIAVNGTRAGPFPFAEFCADSGGCFSVQALRFNGYSNPAGSSAWLDSVSLTRESASGSQPLHELTFDRCGPGSLRPYIAGGVALILPPPDRFLPRGRCSGR
jgi:hypothetical protein